MAWTAKLIDAKYNGSSWKLILEISNGVKTENIALRWEGATVAELKQAVWQHIQSFKKETPPLNLTPYVNQTFDIIPPVVDPPDPDLRAWLADYQQLTALLRVTSAIPALLTPARTTFIAELRTSLNAGWKNKYLEFV